MTIADIQGTGEVTPLNGQRVTTIGYVTATYTEGGFDGFYLQQGGEKTDASNGIFVWLGRGATEYPEFGACVTVTGTAGEYTGETQIADPEVAPSTIAARSPRPSSSRSFPSAMTRARPTRACSCGLLGRTR